MPKQRVIRDSQCPAGLRLAVAMALCLAITAPLSAGCLVVTGGGQAADPQHRQSQSLRVLLTKAGQAARNMVHPTVRRLAVHRQLDAHRQHAQALTAQTRQVLSSSELPFPAHERWTQQHLNLPPPIL